MRNAANNIVQLSYGDDSLDPVCMEGKDGEPIDFARALSQVKADTPSVQVPGGVVPAASAPMPADLTQMLAQRLKLRGLVADSDNYSGKFVESLQKFVQEQVLLLPCVSSCFWLMQMGSCTRKQDIICAIGDSSAFNSSIDLVCMWSTTACLHDITCCNLGRSYCL